MTGLFDKPTSRSDFLIYYAKSEDEIFKGFNRIFLIIVYYSMLGFLMSVLILLVFFSQAGFFALFQAIPVALEIAQFVIVFWLARLVREYFSLRRSLIANQLKNAEWDREQLDMTAKKISELKSQARTIVTTGSHSIVMGDGNIVGAVGHGIRMGDVTVQVSGGQDVTDALALLITYAKSTGNADAVRKSEQLVAEAGKPDKDSAKLFSLWNQIVMLLPGVLKIAEVVDGVAKMFKST